MRITNRKMWLRSGVAAICLLAASNTFAQARSFDVPSEEAVKAIPEFARQAGLQVIAAASQLKGIKTPPIHGEMDVRSALKLLISGTGLVIASDDGSTITLKRAVGAIGKGTEGAQNASEKPVETEVVVTGTHIAGEQPSSPMLSVTQAQITATGQTDLGEFARSLPQSFGGGQNPAVVLGSGGSTNNYNFTGGSSFNLRGLGPDATLTLLDGHRLPYNSSNQSVDISQIPLDAVSRVDVLLDGSSAVYGSDAVGGVVNIILKPDFNGLTLTARTGGATDGGDFQQQYSAVGGATWQGGGLMAAYSYTRSTNINASQRSYTEEIVQPETIYPALTESSAVFRAHQDITTWMHASVDGSYSWRSNEYQLNELPAVNYFNHDVDRSYEISPRIDFDLPISWKASISGVYSEDNVHENIIQYSKTGSVVYHALQCACNGMQSVAAVLNLTESHSQVGRWAGATE
jgi:outer membrane cobalamin receptor